MRFLGVLRGTVRISPIAFRFARDAALIRSFFPFGRLVVGICLEIVLITLIRSASSTFLLMRSEFFRKFFVNRDRERERAVFNKYRDRDNAAERIGFIFFNEYLCSGDIWGTEDTYRTAGRG